MKKFKLYKIFLCILSVVMMFIFSSCSLYIVSLDKLLKAPMSDLELEKAISKSLGSSITIHPPSTSDSEDFTGCLSSSFNYYDIDSDGYNEVITFYTPDSSADEIHMVIVKKINNKWTVVSDTLGAGSEIVSLCIMDLSGNNSQKQIVTTWRYIDNYILNISNFNKDNNGNYKIDDLGERRQFDELKMVDVDSDGNCELVVINYTSSTSSEEKSPYVCVLDMESDNEIKTLGNISLPSDCMEIDMKFSQSYTDTAFVLFFDYSNTNNRFFTEIVYWDKINSKLVYINDMSTVNFSNSNGENFTSKYNTARYSKLKCLDIDNDNLLEVPMSKSFSKELKSENLTSMIVWSKLFFSKDGTCQFSYVKNEQRIYFDDVIYFSVPIYFENDKFYAYSNDLENWSMYYGDFENILSANDNLEGFCIIQVKKINEDDSEKYEELGFTVLGRYNADSEKILVCKLTDYAIQMGLNINDIFNRQNR